jgi:hypothetical protein
VQKDNLFSVVRHWSAGGGKDEMAERIVAIFGAGDVDSGDRNFQLAAEPFAEKLSPPQAENWLWFGN